MVRIVKQCKSLSLRIGLSCVGSTIADIALYPWAEDAESAGFDIERFPSLTAWYNRMNERPAGQKGVSV